MQRFEFRAVELPNLQNFTLLVQRFKLWFP